MFSSATGNLFMILASQAQKEAPKAVVAPVQGVSPTVQLGSNAFDLLLAFMGAGSDLSGQVGDGSALMDSSQGEWTDVDLELIADRDQLAAKIAAMLASNPASTPALSGLALALGTESQGLSAALQGSGFQSQQLQSILAKLQVGGGQAVSVDGAERGLALISAIQNAKDPQSAAAVLMAAVAGNAASATSLNKSGSSNLLVANGLYGDLSLADALAQTALTGGSAASGSHLTGLGAPGDSLAEAQAALISNESGLASAVRKSESSAEDGPDFTDSRSTEDAHRQRLESVDAMLSVSASDAQQGLVQLQQSMASQPLGKAAIANANALEGSVSWLASQRGGSATIDLTPPDLGSLRLELKIDAAGESAVLVVHAANESAKAAIEQSLDRLYESFQHAGMSLQVSIGGSSTGFSSAFANEFSADQGGASSTAQQRVEGRSNALAGVTTLATKVQDGLSLYV